jgi:antitoxin component of RelBE/YafQ-DinJ toxin-antitoxin module
MSKNNWAKGRQKCKCTIAVDEETRDAARMLAHEIGVTIKDMVAIALRQYQNGQSPKKDAC